MTDTVPTDWETKTLGEFCSPITKGTSPPQFVDEGINFIRSANFSKSDKIVSSQVLKIDKQTHDSFERSKLKSGDILFSITGDLGRVAEVKERHLPANINQNLAIVRIDTDLLNQGYCKHFLRSHFCQDQVKREQTISAQPSLNLKQISNLTILLPSLVEQEKIAEILTSLDDQIESVELKLVQLESLKKSLMGDLLTGRVRVSVD